MNKICLVSTLHDPDGKLRSPIRDYYNGINKLFSNAVIKMTEATSWNDDCYTTVIRHNSKPAVGRLIALERALETNCNLFFLLDFDRLLYWYTVFLGELVQVLKGLTDGLTVIGRTKAAFETHPKLQQLTEEAANLVFAHWFGKRMDILAGCRVIPRAIAEKIVVESNPKNIAQVDAEWLLIANQRSLKYFEVNGLGYEHSLFGLDKPVDVEVRTRVENLNAIMECVIK